MLIENEVDLQISFDQIFYSPYKEYLLGFLQLYFFFQLILFLNMGSQFVKISMVRAFGFDMYDETNNINVKQLCLFTMIFLDVVIPKLTTLDFIQINNYETRDLEGRRIKIVQIFPCILLNCFFKATAFDTPSQLLKWR